MTVVPLFVCTGFLDSGKTTLVKETLMEQEWIQPGRTLLICCEEGEVEYPEEYLKSKNMVLHQVTEKEQLTSAFFKSCNKKYRPVQVVIEYNGMWKLEDLLSIKYPYNWELQGVYSTVNGLTLDMYLKNMRNMLMEQLTESELIVVNRCAEGVDRSGFRRALKVQNPMAQLIFEDTEGRIIQPSSDDLPYDTGQDVIEIADEDFGIWYVDAYDHPDRYLNKTMVFKAQIFRPKGMEDNMFVPVRKIMTCCAADIRFYGYPCRSKKKIEGDKRKYYQVTARFAYESVGFGNEQPVLYLEGLEEAEKPREDVVYLG